MREKRIAQDVKETELSQDGQEEWNITRCEKNKKHLMMTTQKEWVRKC